MNNDAELHGNIPIQRGVGIDLLKQSLIKVTKDAYIISNQDQGIGKKNENPNLNQPAKTKNPNICIIHCFFKTLCALIYIIGPYLTSNTLSSGLSIIIFAAFDFWIVKNISGRYLVGLRWWTEHQEDGKEKWVFECRPNENQVNPFDSKVFWFVNIGFILGWITVIFFNLFFIKFTMLIPIVCCVAEIIFNTYAFYKCSKVQQKRVREILDNAKNGVQNFAMNNLMKSIKLPMKMDVKI